MAFNRKSITKIMAYFGNYNQHIRIEIFISELGAKGKIKGAVEAFYHAYQSNSG